MTDVVSKLNTLIDLTRSQDPEVINLLPGLTSAQIARKTQDLPFELPEEIYQLYQWRNGLSEGRNPFLFGDHCLSNLDETLETYHMLWEAYSDLVEDYNHIIDWQKCFPFADFEGSYLLLVCGDHMFKDRYPNPIICMFEGIDIYFVSFDKMLDTCIEWSQQLFDKYGTPNNRLEIWKKHNPGVFDIDILQLM